MRVVYGALGALPLTDPSGPQAQVSEQVAVAQEALRKLAAPGLRVSVGAIHRPFDFEAGAVRPAEVFGQLAGFGDRTAAATEPLASAQPIRLDSHGVAIPM